MYVLVPKGGLEPPRVTSHAPQTCASTSSATSAQLGKDVKDSIPVVHFLDGALAGVLVASGVSTVERGTAAGLGVVSAAAAGDGEAVGACSGTPDCKTERVPVMAGRERIKANNMNPAAAPMVIFDSSVCVPLGPKAVLETELENRAPASALPG